MEICSTLRHHCKDLCRKNGKIGLRAIMQCRPHLVGNGCDFRTSWAGGHYNVRDETANFYLSIKPWRLVAMQHHIININIDMPSRELEEPFLQKLTNDRLLVSSTQCLVHPNKVKFEKLLQILKRLPEIKKLEVRFNNRDKATTEHICHALSSTLPRLCSLQVKVGRYANSSAAILFSQLRHGYFKMLQVDTMSINCTELAYRSCQLHVNSPEDEAQWVKYAHLYTSLAYIAILQSSDTPNLTTSLPPNLVSLNIESSCYTSFPLSQQPQTRLRRLVLNTGRVQWNGMALRCPNVRFMKLFNIDFEGPVTVSLPLTHLILYYVTETSRAAFVRHMCKAKLHHLKAYARKTILKCELKDWMANPDFLLGAGVAWGFHHAWTEIYEKKMNSNKRSTLFLLKSLLFKK